MIRAIISLLIATIAILVLYSAIERNDWVAFIPSIISLIISSIVFGRSIVRNDQ